MLWQLAHVALARCSARRSRTERVAATVLSLSAGTSGNGGGGGVPLRFSRIHLPRITGEVRVAYDVTVRTLLCRSKLSHVERLIFDVDLACVTQREFAVCLERDGGQQSDCDQHQ